MAPLSAGIIMWRRRESGPEVLLAHFGGPYWANKDVGAWAIPKGLVEADEDPQDTARREFAEELGIAPDGELIALGRIRQKGGKWVEAFALEGDLDSEAIVSNHFTVEWPPRSGSMQSFPEVDRAKWFSLDEARKNILPSQRIILDLLQDHLGNG